MHTPDHESAQHHLHLAERWRHARAAYRMANLASHHVLGFTVKLALLVYFTFMLVFLLLRYAVLPHIDYYKGDIEKLASRALGNEVAISRIYASWRGLRPNLFLGDVVLRDRAGRQVLALPSVSATVSWWSVLALEPRFDSLELIRPDLDIERGRDGKIVVAGIVLNDQGGDKGGADWAFQQREVVVREGRLRWTDQLRGAPPLVLENVHLVLLNRWTEHRVGLRATPPPALGRPIDVRAAFSHPRFAQRIADPRLWKGELYADVRETDLAGWKAYVDYPFEVSEGKGAVRAWLSLDHARLAGFTADLGLAGVEARLGKDLPPLSLARVAGRLSARETFAPGVQEGTPTFGAHGHTVVLTDFAVETKEGLVLPATTIAETFTPARGNAPQQLDVTARRLELSTVARLAGQLPLSPLQRAMLDEFAPRGRVEDLTVQVQGKYPAIAAYRVRAQVSDLGLNPQAARAAQPKTAAAPAQAALPALPGFDHLSGTVEASDKGGALKLAAPGLVLHMPAWFAEPDLAFDKLELQARWSREGKGEKAQLKVDVENFDFAQGKLTGRLKGHHTLALGAAARGPGVADFEGEVDGFQINTIGRYLPLQTPEHLRDWLTGALEEGTAREVALRLRGDLAHFPFRADTPAARARGEFRVAGRLAGARLNYAPGRFAADGKAPLWPQADKIDGSIVFDRTRMEIKGDTAVTGGVALSGVKAVVADLWSHDLMLDIDGSAAGPLQEFLRYVAASPVLEWIGRFTEDSQATGNARLGLKLHLPLNHLVDAKVTGSLALQGNEVLLFNDLPPLQAAMGKIEFNEHGVALNGVVGNFLGGPIAVTGGSQRDNSILVKLAGAVTSEGLRKQYGAPALQGVIGKVSGGTRFTGAVLVKDHQAQVTVDSTMTGIGLDFPAPANKPEAESMPLHFLLSTLPGEKGVARDEVKLSLGSTIAARYQRQKTGKGPWTVLRGGVGVNVPAPEPDSGMTVNVNLKTLNVDHWVALGRAVAGGKGETRARSETDGPDLSQYIVPDAMAARSAELIVGERKLDNVVVGTSHQNNTWQASIDSKQVSGHIMWNESNSGQGLGKVTARLASLIIPESAANDVKDLLEDSKSAASSIPALDIVAERFELFNKQLGKLELLANNVPAAAGREWRINKLALATGDADFAATGKWITRDGKSSSSLNFKLDIEDAGKLLDRLGFPETLRRGKGKMSGELMWNGLPYALDIPSLSGQIDMNVENGQFLKQDPGAAKLLGVLSLQALPRLLKLDFHDVFSEGLAFDGITSSAVIGKGVLRTDNLRMHGVAATVLMDGTADIANETTNLHVVVIPEFNLGTGPLVYALAVNPVVGLSSLLAQYVLRVPVMKALTYEMQVAGAWKAPTITKLDSARAVVPAAPTTKVQ
jgi:uncharacterized protein (TIGR02099 family)